MAVSQLRDGRRLRVRDMGGQRCVVMVRTGQGWEDWLEVRHSTRFAVRGDDGVLLPVWGLHSARARAFDVGEPIVIYGGVLRSLADQLALREWGRGDHTVQVSAAGDCLDGSACRSRAQYINTADSMRPLGLQNNARFRSCSDCLTKLTVEAVRPIVYGEEFFASYGPAWHDAGHRAQLRRAVSLDAVPVQSVQRARVLPGWMAEYSCD